MILEILFTLFILILVGGFISLAPWVPTRSQDFKRVADIVQLRPKEKLLEMGCGDASVSLYLAKNHSESHIVGIELSLAFYLISKWRVWRSGLKNIEIKYGNSLKQDLGSYDVLYVFGLPETVTKKVFPRIKDIKKKNFRLISYCFQMTNDYFKETRHKPEGRYSIYEYRL